ncbi:Glycosyltransferase involved in cell wall bisynthesis [Desulfonispora thiosulfatigenes DSM 11270]|uniref:Glycosyltransferase involved in cell wall bisynthesis n=1 Tax=Desulfonispora thiosulfatigenes DSM 11270 TaxID=656914 RepID=A0A1W1V5K3_DESTI|nr:glycosyltransferase [Desulfonispora thiosulfatigenes]SMB88652.1 Glycosyltransferase involved in cell wall bisynthesis [Desulfonispora thiosulfatigenes DSM 11270]
MKKYVIYIGTIFLPDKNAAAQRAIMISKLYKENGYTPIIIGACKDIDSSTAIVDTYANYFGFDTYSMAYPRSNVEWLKRLVDINPILKVIDEYGEKNIHSLVIMDYMSIALWKLMKYSKRMGIRFVIDTVDWFNKSEYRFPKNIIKDIDTSLRMRFIHKKANYMISISKYLYNYYKGKVENIVIIPSIADVRDCKWSQLSGYKENEFLTLGYAGDPGEKFERERLDWLIKIVSQMNKKDKKIKLLMAGVNKEKIANNLPHLKSIIDNDELIVFLGRIPHKDCLDMIATSDFSVIIRENTLVNLAGFPTKLSESYACSTPVITTPSSNISDYVINAQNGFLTKEISFESLKDLIEQLHELNSKSISEMHETTRRINRLKLTNFTKDIQKVIE